MGKKTKNTGPNFIIRDILSINFCTKLVRVYRADNITFVVVYSTILKMRQAEERRNRMERQSDNEISALKLSAQYK